MQRHYILGERFALVRDHSGLRYLFNQPNLNASQARCLDTLSEFDFETRCIKGKENQVVDCFNKRVNANHISTVSCYGKNLRDNILHVGQYDDKYQQVKRILQ